jgi:hypothetical protein
MEKPTLAIETSLYWGSHTISRKVFLKCIHGREVRVEYTVEADDYILMRPVSEGYIWLEASHMSCGCQVAEKDLREALQGLISN